MKMYQNKTGKFDKYKFFNMAKNYDAACWDPMKGNSFFYDDFWSIYIFLLTISIRTLSIYMSKIINTC